MNESFLEALIAWQQGGRREVIITFSNLRTDEIEVRMYDSSIGEFFYPKCIEDIPKDMITEARNKLLGNIAYYQKRLEELDGKEASGQDSE